MPAGTGHLQRELNHLDQLQACFETGLFLKPICIQHHNHLDRIPPSRPRVHSSARDGDVNGQWHHHPHQRALHRASEQGWPPPRRCEPANHASQMSTRRVCRAESRRVSGHLDGCGRDRVSGNGGIWHGRGTLMAPWGLFDHMSRPAKPCPAFAPPCSLCVLLGGAGLVGRNTARPAAASGAGS